uniref:Fe2OG dioxygenase domain-containing protein n=1 Tax=Strongyloides papillosus TaxID=174720 RepID=A0A0N5CB44_STREA
MSSDISTLKGLRILENYICDDDATILIEIIEKDLIQHSESLKNRTVIHYGYKFNYNSNSAFHKTIPIPPQILEIIDRLKNDNLVVMNEVPDQVTVNIYEESQGIPYHTDTHSAFGKQIFSLSLLSDVVMQFKNCANPTNLTNVLLRKNSLLIMEDESRYAFKHGILTRKYDTNPSTNESMKRKRRISITFRKIKESKCQCKFIEFCDWDRNTKIVS